MPSLEYFLVARSCSIDQLTNQVSIFHVLEEITAKLPAPIEVFSIAAWNLKEDEIGKDFQAVVTMSGAGLNPNPFPLNFSGQSPRQRSVMHFAGVLLSEPGALHFDLTLNNAHQASHTVDVKDTDA